MHVCVCFDGALSHCQPLRADDDDEIERLQAGAVHYEQFLANHAIQYDGRPSEQEIDDWLDGEDDWDYDDGFVVDDSAPLIADLSADELDNLSGSDLGDEPDVPLALRLRQRSHRPTRRNRRSLQRRAHDSDDDNDNDNENNVVLSRSDIDGAVRRLRSRVSPRVFSPPRRRQQRRATPVVIDLIVSVLF